MIEFVILYNIVFDARIKAKYLFLICGQTVLCFVQIEKCAHFRSIELRSFANRESTGEISGTYL